MTTYAFELQFEDPLGKKIVDLVKFLEQNDVPIPPNYEPYINFLVIHSVSPLNNLIDNFQELFPFQGKLPVVLTELSFYATNDQLTLSVAKSPELTDFQTEVHSRLVKRGVHGISKEYLPDAWNPGRTLCQSIPQDQRADIFDKCKYLVFPLTGYVEQVRLVEYSPNATRSVLQVHGLWPDPADPPVIDFGGN